MDDIRIYIADQRGEIESDNVLVKSTLNYGSFSAPYRSPIGKLKHVNEWRGKGTKSIFSLTSAKGDTHVVVPLAGDLSITIGTEKHEVLLGTVFIYQAADNATGLVVSSLTAEDDEMVFQELIFSSVKDTLNLVTCLKLPIVDLNQRNKVLPLDNDAFEFRLYFGAFVGRHTFHLSLDEKFSNFFILTLDGTFEVEERLLYTGDALFLPRPTQVETECLSTAGLLLAIYF
ncbi:hypothetical protein [Sphingobacterium sp. LRF_L2]|uniref:hypothetical protein n=1 Tax=Sphingobacterium sp. LRF_L2 TaxID=3369421 RepID=UPI003F6107AC